MDVLMQDCIRPPVPTPEVIDLTDEDDEEGSLEGTLMEIEEIGGPIEYAWSSNVNNHLSNKELELVRAIESSPIPEEDYSEPTAAVDQEADMIVRASIAAPSYECLPPYLPVYGQVEYRLQW